MCCARSPAGRSRRVSRFNGVSARLAAVLVFSAVTLVACGEDESSGTVPAACLAGPTAYLSALESAPGAVLLEGSTPIGDCITEDQGAGQLAGVGEAVVAAATRLNHKALEEPSGEATVQLGYLVGAVQEAAATSGGIHEDLVRRLDAAARFTPGGDGPGAAFERAFGEGYAAGQGG